MATQTFLPLRLSTGLVDGGFYCTPQDFFVTKTRTVDQVTLPDGHVVQVQSWFSLQHQRHVPCAVLTWGDEYDGSYRSWSCYASVDQASTLSVWYHGTQGIAPSKMWEEQGSLFRTIRGENDNTRMAFPRNNGDGTDVLTLEDVYDAMRPVEELPLLTLPELPGTFITTTAPTQEPLPYQYTDYLHDQVVAAKLWTIDHNLNKQPAVNVVNAGGAPVLAEQLTIVYVDENTLTIEFAEPTGGVARCA